jgi:hypothetical protein
MFTARDSARSSTSDLSTTQSHGSNVFTDMTTIFGRDHRRIPNATRYGTAGAFHKTI